MRRGARSRRCGRPLAREVIVTVALGLLSLRRFSDTRTLRPPRRLYSRMHLRLQIGWIHLSYVCLLQRTSPTFSRAVSSSGVVLTRSAYSSMVPMVPCP